MKRVIIVLFLFVPGPALAQQTILETLQQVRAEYPADWSHEDRGEYLNKVAFLRSRMGEDFGLLRKPGGNRCPTPQGVDVSCDYLVYRPTMDGYDVLGDETTPTWPGIDQPSDNFSATPERFLAPISVGIVEPPVPDPTPVPDPVPGPQPGGQLDRIEAKLDAHIESTEVFQSNVGSEWRAVKTFLKEKGLYILGALLSGKYLLGSN